MLDAHFLGLLLALRLFLRAEAEEAGGVRRALLVGAHVVSTGLEGNHFRRFSGIQFGPGASGRQHNALSPQQAPPLVAEFFLHATQPGLEQATTLRRTQQERQWWSTAHAVAIAGRPHVRVVVARSVPEIQSAGEPKRIATSIFAALRQREHVHKSAPHWLSADSSPMASRMTVRDFGGLGQGPVTPGLPTEILNQHDVALKRIDTRVHDSVAVRRNIESQRDERSRAYV